ncbi:MAG TPA: hypothetical protein VHC00_10640 [Rhizobiaceae bacterium]|nr:hypothetical protein [Rhizobiaceae bacterium]
MMTANLPSKLSRSQNSTDTISRPVNLSAIIGRIEATIEQETAAIRGNLDFDIPASNARKSRYLYELNKAARCVSPLDISTEERTQLVRLREKLAANEAAILAHINAVTEVAALIQKAIQRAEADGTYSAREFAGDRIPS